MRLFVALAISEQLRESLASLVQTVREADLTPRWINPRNFHITLKFIGEVPPEKLAPIGEALAAARLAQKLTLEVRGLGFFPNARRPAVVWAGLEPADLLAQLAATIDQALATVGIPREGRPFIPHLTLARFKQTRVWPTLAERVNALQHYTFGTVSVSEFHLLQSKLKSGGAEYTTLRSFGFVDH